jgi:hypothetical protein
MLQHVCYCRALSLARTAVLTTAVVGVNAMREERAQEEAMPSAAIAICG